MTPRTLLPILAASNSTFNKSSNSKGVKLTKAPISNSHGGFNTRTTSAWSELNKTANYTVEFGLMNVATREYRRINTLCHSFKKPKQTSIKRIPKTQY